MIDWCWVCFDPMSPVSGCGNVDCPTHLWAAGLVAWGESIRVSLGMLRAPSKEEVDHAFQEAQFEIEASLVAADAAKNKRKRPRVR